MMADVVIMLVALRDSHCIVHELRSVGGSRAYVVTESQSHKTYHALLRTSSKPRIGLADQQLTNV